jgi:hypothetical protein
MAKQRYWHERDKLWITLYSKNAFQLIHCHMLHTVKFLKGRPLMFRVFKGWGHICGAKFASFCCTALVKLLDRVSVAGRMEVMQIRREQEQWREARQRRRLEQPAHQGEARPCPPVAMFVRWVAPPFYILSRVRAFYSIMEDGLLYLCLSLNKQ